jgi:tetratricopeptide (TPR) repeat protein
LNTYSDQDIALIGKGRAFFRLGNYSGAIVYFDKVLSMNSSDIDISNEASKNKIAALSALRNVDSSNGSIANDLAN